VSPVATVRDLGVYLDADVSLAAHVTAIVRACFAALRQIHSVRCSVSRDALMALIRALLVSKSQIPLRYPGRRQAPAGRRAASSC